MKHVTLEEAQADLARLVEAAAKGEPFVIEAGGRPLVEVRAAPEHPGAVDPSKRIGFMVDVAARIGPVAPIKEVGREEIAEMFGLNDDPDERGVLG